MSRHVQETSLDAYRQIQPSLGDKQRQVYKLLEKASLNGFDMTDKEIGKALHWPINTVTPRRGELVELGLVTVSQIRFNDTGKRAIAWKVKQP